MSATPSPHARGRDIFVLGVTMTLAVGLVMAFFRARPSPPRHPAPDENSLAQPLSGALEADFGAYFAEDLATSQRFESSLVWRELIALTVVIAVVVARQLWFI